MMSGFNFKKSVQALNYFAINSGGSINKMKAIKLIWLSDREHMRKYGRTITGDSYFAMKNGPVPSGTKDVLNASDFASETAYDYSTGYLTEIDQYNFRSLTPVNEKVFSETELTIISEIFEACKDVDHFHLSELSHSFPEWQKFESYFESGSRTRFPINQLDFFKADAKHFFVSSEEELTAAMEIYKETERLNFIL